MIRGWVVFIVSLFLVFSSIDRSYAEDARREEPISLREAIEKALSNNATLLAAGYRVEGAEAGIIKARSGYLPRVEVSEIYQRTTNPMWAFGHKLNQESISAADFAPSRLNNPDPINNWGTVISLTQPLYSGGKVASYYDQARLNREAVLKDQERIRQENVYEVTKAYYGIPLAESNLEVVNDALKTSEANMQMARSLVTAGVAVESDFLSARVNWAELREEEIRASNEVALSKAGLSSAMGVGIDAEYRPTEMLGENLDKIGTEYSLLDERSKQAEAFSERPDLAGIKLREKLLEKGVRVVQADNLPTVGLMANYEIDGSDPVSADGRNWTIMGVLKWNLFSGYENTARVSEARAESGRTREMKREMENRISLEVLNARLELKAARERAYVATESVKEAEEGYRIIRNRYNEGMTTMVDLLGAGTALKKAKQRLAHALYDYKVGEARLKLALGILK